VALWRRRLMARCWSAARDPLFCMVTLENRWPPGHRSPMPQLVPTIFSAKPLKTPV
jgi:hypothetical protein